jgi:CheY-like chemotaxis protein
MQYPLPLSVTHTRSGRTHSASVEVAPGWEATRTIKSDSKLRRIPIIAVTAHAAKEDWDGIRAAGCDSFLAKPVDEKALFDALRHYLGSPVEA